MSTQVSLPHPRLAQATLLFASMLTIMAGATVSPALPAIQRAFSTVPHAVVLVGLVLTLPGLFIAVGAPLIGSLVDRYGRRRLLLGSTVVYALAGGSGFILNSLVAILIGRAVLGVAVAGEMVTVTALITDYYEEERRQTVLGRQAAFMSLGGVILLPLAGVLADISWRVPFLVYTVALLLLPALIVVLPEPERQEFIGDRPTSIAELRMTLSRFPLRTFALIFALALVAQIVFYMVPVQIPFLLTSQMGASGILVGGAIAVQTGVGGVISMLYGRIRRYLGVLPIVALTFGFMSVGYVVIGVSQTLFGIVAGLALAGIGTGLILPNLNTWIGAITPEAVRGRALSGLTSGIFLGQFLSPILTRPVSEAVGLNTTFLGVGVVLAGVAVVFVFVTMSGEPRIELEPDSDEQPATESALD